MNTNSWRQTMNYAKQQYPKLNTTVLVCLTLMCKLNRLHSVELERRFAEMSCFRVRQQQRVGITKSHEISEAK
jgi:hypothetical protein